jgi:hypothetical protein
MTIKNPMVKSIDEVIKLDYKSLKKHWLEWINFNFRLDYDVTLKLKKREIEEPYLHAVHRIYSMKTYKLQAKILKQKIMPILRTWNKSEFVGRKDSLTDSYSFEEIKRLFVSYNWNYDIPDGRAEEYLHNDDMSELIVPESIFKYGKFTVDHTLSKIENVKFKMSPLMRSYGWDDYGLVVLIEHSNAFLTFNDLRRLLVVGQRLQNLTGYTPQLIISQFANYDENDRESFRTGIGFLNFGKDLGNIFYMTGRNSNNAFEDNGCQISHIALSKFCNTCLLKPIGKEIKHTDFGDYSCYYRCASGLPMMKPH